MDKIQPVNFCAMYFSFCIGDLVLVTNHFQV